MTINDIISMGIAKEITLGNIAIKWLGVACLLYSSQMLLFYKGLQSTQMGVLNLTWNLFSNIAIVIVGLYYYKESVTHYDMYGILFGLFAIGLFGMGQIYGKN